MDQQIVITLNSPISPSYGPVFDITADVGVVTPHYATLAQLLGGFVTSANVLATHFTITPVFSDCPAIEVIIQPPCKCYAAYTGVELYTISWTDCNGDPQSEPFTDKKPTYCSQTLPVLSGGEGGRPMVNEIPEVVCTDGTCVTDCKCFIVTNPTEQDLVYNYIDCAGTYQVDNGIKAGDSYKYCGTFVSIEEGGTYELLDSICEEGKEAPTCPRVCKCVFFSVPKDGVDGSFSFKDCNDENFYSEIKAGDSYRYCVDTDFPINVTSSVDYMILEDCVLGEGLMCPYYPYQCWTVSLSSGTSAVYRYIDYDGIIQENTITVGIQNICTFQPSIVKVSGDGVLNIAGPGDYCSSNEDCNK